MGAACTGLFSQSLGGEPGDIEVEVRLLDLRGGAATINTKRSAPSIAHGGAIRITADEMTMDSALIATDALFKSPTPSEAAVPVVADAGDVSVRTRSLRMQGSSLISGITLGSGSGGDIHVAADDILLSGIDLARRPSIASRTMGPGDGGDLLIEARNLTLQGPSSIAASTWSPKWVWKDFLGRSPNPISDAGAGDAGSLTVRVENLLHLSDGGTLGSVTWSGGDAGDIEIRARSLVLEGTGLLHPTDYRLGMIASTTGRGEDFFTGKPFTNPPDYTRLFDIPAGNGGDIDIGVEELRNDGGIIFSSTSSEGSAGDVTIRANRVLATAPPEGNIYSIESDSYPTNPRGVRTYEVLPFVHGPSGHVRLLGTGSDSELRVEGATVVSASTSTAAAGGNLTIDFDRVIVDGGVLSVASQFPVDYDPAKWPPGSEVEKNVRGRAGDLSLIVHDSLQVLDGGRITAQSYRGDGGNVDIQAINSVELFGGSITAEVGIDGGAETAGGNISIDPTWVILEDGSVISADAHEGHGGNVSIRTQGLFVSPDSRISASSELGVDGTVAVDSPETNLAGELASLSQAYLDAGSLIGDRCGAGAGSFALRDGPAVLAAPDGMLASPLLRLAANGLAQAR
jgi:hypothetical protein